MNSNTPWEELARYFAGELSKEKEEKMESWIKADPEREKKVQKLYKIWKESAASPYQLDVDKAWRTLSRNMDHLEQEIRSTSQDLQGVRSGAMHKHYVQDYRESQRAGSVMRRAIMTAVAATVMLAAGLFTYYNYSVENKENIEIGSRELIAQNGERATYVLNDGSKIILHAGSRLEIPLQFNDSKRELFLEGEAYFEVAHDATKPFIVHSENAETRVLGTKFLVQAWPDADSGVEVVVTEGKVALGPRQESDMRGRKEITITRNQKGVFSKDAGAMVIDKVDMNWYMGWTQGRMVFNDRPLNEIIPKLERWYAIEIELREEEIGANKLTAEIDYSQPMGEVLRGIAMTLDLKLEKMSQRTFIYNSKSEGEGGRL